MYRRMGSREHERLINEASNMKVDAVQSANVVRTVGDQGYAALFSDMHINPNHARELQTAQRDATNPFARQWVAERMGSTGDAATGQTHTRQRTSPPAPPAQPAQLSPLPSPPSVDDAVVVPRQLWPSYACRELGGAGWQAVVVRVHSSAALVRFTYPRTRDGRAYEDELLPFDSLRVLA